MRYANIFAGLIAAASASFLEEEVRSLDISNIQLTYSEQLPCLGCIRSGNIFCQTGTNFTTYGSVCCDPANSTCYVAALAKYWTCGTTNPTYTNIPGFFKDTVNMIATQCAQRFVTTTDNGCGCPAVGSGQSTFYTKGCQIQQSFPQVDSTININQDLVAYGDGCFYGVETQCGYPSVTFTGGSNLDIVMAYNTSLWNGMAINNS